MARYNRTEADHSVAAVMCAVHRSVGRRSDLCIGDRLVVPSHLDTARRAGGASRGIGGGDSRSTGGQVGAGRRRRHFGGSGTVAAQAAASEADWRRRRRRRRRRRDNSKSRSKADHEKGQEAGEVLRWDHRAVKQEEPAFDARRRARRIHHAEDLAVLRFRPQVRSYSRCRSWQLHTPGAPPAAASAATLGGGDGGGDGGGAGGGGATRRQRQLNTETQSAIPCSCSHM